MSDWKTLSDDLRLTLRPIDRWPGKETRSRAASPYKRSGGDWTPLRETLTTLGRELRMLQARNIVLQVAFRDRDFRQDGLPRADARADHPGIILAFDSKHGPMRIFFDGFTRWQCCLRGIALHLEHLRLASLYGVGADGQQYRGWAALPETAGQETDLTPEALLLRVAQSNGWRASQPVDWSEVIRQAQKRAHPDAGGSHELFLAVQQAAEQLRARR